MKADVAQKEVDIELLVQNIIKDLKFMDDWERFDFQVNVNLEYPFVTDMSRINTILKNLITNSIKYYNLEEPSPIIKIDILSKRDSKVISVADNGQGIPDKYHEQVFDMFFRGTERSTGSGLGLYIVAEIVEKMNGHINLVSAPNKGTNFTITF